VVVSIGSIARAIGLVPKHEVRDRNISALKNDLVSAKQTNNVFFSDVRGTAMYKQNCSLWEAKEQSLSEILKNATNMLGRAKAEGSSAHKINALTEVISDVKHVIKKIPAMKEVLDWEIRAEIKESNDPHARAIARAIARSIDNFRD
jgi:hypothetical protein